jgi:hypothetical protein
MGGEITVLSKIKSGTSIQIKAPISYKKANYARFSISIISKSFILSPITKRNIVSHLMKTACRKHPDSYAKDRASCQTSLLKYANGHK